MTKAAVSMGLQMVILFPLDIPSSEIVGLYGIPIFNFLQNLYTLFHGCLYQFTFPSTVYKDSLSSTFPPGFVISYLSENVHEQL